MVVAASLHRNKYLRHPPHLDNMLSDVGDVLVRGESVGSRAFTDDGFTLELSGSCLGDLCPLMLCPGMEATMAVWCIEVVEGVMVTKRGLFFLGVFQQSV